MPPKNTRSSPKGDVSKENINGNKAEAPKLSVEPQQMKRKKKGGGYNLRKSLAWDRAFFTEEGMLSSSVHTSFSQSYRFLKLMREAIIYVGFVQVF